jgi:hypothetical protein
MYTVYYISPDGRNFYKRKNGRWWLLLKKYRSSFLRKNYHLHTDIKKYYTHQTSLHTKYYSIQTTTTKFVNKHLGAYKCKIINIIY